MGIEFIFSATVGFAIAGIDNHDLVYFAIVVPVVLLPVGNLRLGQLDGFGDKGSCPHVASEPVPAVGCRCTTHGDGAKDVEGELEFAVGLLKEIVMDGTHKAVCVAIVWLIDDFVVKGMAVAGVKLHVGELRQDDKPLLLACINGSPVLCGFLYASHAPPLVFLEFCLAFTNGKVCHLGVLTVRIHIAFSVCTQPVAAMFITHKSGSHFCSVLQSQRFPHTLFHRQSHCSKGCHTQHCCYK